MLFLLLEFRNLSCRMTWVIVDQTYGLARRYNGALSEVISRVSIRFVLLSISLTNGWMFGSFLMPTNRDTECIIITWWNIHNYMRTWVLEASITGRDETLHPTCIVGCDYLSMSMMPDSGTQILIYNPVITTQLPWCFARSRWSSWTSNCW